MKHKIYLKNKANNLFNNYGQMSVELCVTLPVILIFLVIAIDGMVFINACSKFDHVANQAILAFACSQDGNEFDEEEALNDVKKAMEEASGKQHASVEVEAQKCGIMGDLVKYTCQLNYFPWPLSANQVSIFGVNLSASLKHKRVFVVRAFAPGKL